MSDSFFSDCYAQARQRFIASINEVGGTHYSYPLRIAGEADLCIDVAVIGCASNNAIVISSGVHGVEGFFGSAVQLAVLDRLRTNADAMNIKYVLIHAVNPYGFAKLRRFNESNVDLNRNFLEDTESYAGAPEGYSGLNSFLNPESAPRRFEPFRLKALWNIWRNGMAALKESVAGGQYQYPHGLFFGGQEASHSTRLIRQHCDEWLGSSAKVFHVDFHTGLGAYGTVKILLNETDRKALEWYENAFGADRIEPLSSIDGTAYKVSGHFGGWIQNHFSARDYRFAGAEYGTYDVIRVLQSIRSENRAHHYSSAESEAYLSSKQELLECFCPADIIWRRTVLSSALDIIDRAGKAL